MARPWWSRPAGRVDLGRPAELAHHHDQGPVEQPAIGQVGDQGRHPLIEGRGEGVLDGREVLGVGVPAELARPAVADGDEGDARLDQPAAPAGTIAPGGSGRSGRGRRRARCRSLKADWALLDVRRSIRLAGEPVARGGQRGGRHVAREAVERPDHRLTALQAVERHAVRRRQVADAEARALWVVRPRRRGRRRASGIRSTRRGGPRAPRRRAAGRPPAFAPHLRDHAAVSSDRPGPGSADIPSAGDGPRGRGRPPARSCCGSGSKRSSVAASLGKTSLIRTPADARVDRLELAPHVRGRVGLGVEGVDVRRAPRQPDQDAPLGLLRAALARPTISAPARGAGKVVEAEAPGREQARLQEGAAAGPGQSIGVGRMGGLPSSDPISG